MEDKSIIIGAVLILVAVLFILLIIPNSRKDILGTIGSDTVKFGANGSPSPAPTPNITELQAQRIQVGSGSAQVKAGDTITVHYMGAFTDGKVFDSSYQRNEPLTINVGAQQIIPGFEQGVMGMLIGEKRRLLIPANLAYGAQGSGPIPPNTPLIFEVELLTITPAASAQQPAEQPAAEPTAVSAAESPTPSPEQ